MKKSGKLVGPYNGNFYMRYDGGRGKYISTKKEYMHCKRVLGDKCKQYLSSTTSKGTMVGNIFNGSDVDVKKVKEHERKQKRKLVARAIKKIKRDEEMK